ncbi:hypothetical protein PPYR_10540, partial [Photinus pyralis]
KLFFCDRCGRRYKRKTHLSSHVRYECGKDPQFSCNLCDKRFHQKSNLTTHIKKYHN